VEKLYISRELIVGEQRCDEVKLLDSGSLFLVLAEPGAGKTDLLSKLAAILDVAPVRANVFRSKPLSGRSEPLVIDAMDEVARVDPLGVEDIILKASGAGSCKVIFAARSSEWDMAETEHVKDYFGIEPVVVRLEAFSNAEQRQLFEANFPTEDFEAFSAECQRFELGALLGNPQFLLLFGEAYIQSARHFTSKKAIYHDAVRRLAHEANTRAKRLNRPSNDDIVDMACEVFAKLMLSGVSGVSSNENLKSKEFPYLRSLVADRARDPRVLTDTRLFKPSFETGQHEPIHRIVAEYCAAKYLIGRIDDPADRLSMARSLAIIAPNGAVRTELRGMLGWMAALAHGQTQRQFIELDPYAVLANGDPSELSPQSKKELLKALSMLAGNNPLFRRSDSWRQFNVGAFFSADVQEEIAILLDPATDDGPLRDLILELLSSSHASGQFQPELRALALNAARRRGVRKAAFELLLDNTTFDPRPDLAALLSEASHSSLELVAGAVRSLGSDNVERTLLVDLLRKLAELHPKDADFRNRNLESRYFIKTLVKSFDQDSTAYALDELTNGLSCTCNPKSEYLCKCRLGISRVVGLLLDHHLPTVSDPVPARVWGWTKALVYRNSHSGDDSPAVKFLEDRVDLRRALQRLAIAGLTGSQVAEAISRLFHSNIHSGIRFHSGDIAAMTQYAFDKKLVDVWSALWLRHNIHDEHSRASPQRTLMRSHANGDPRFMKVWAKFDRSAKRDREERRFSFRSSRRRFERQEAQSIESRRAHFTANLGQIESGAHWGWLWEFACSYLYEPEKLDSSEYGDTPTRALRNCIPFLSQHIPTLQQLARREWGNVAQAFFAHCLVRFRGNESFDDLDLGILRAAVTEAGYSPGLESEDELRAIEAELNRMVFPDGASVEAFARTFIEPPLASSEDIPTNVDWLERKAIFHPMRAILPLEWLRRYPDMPASARASLFAMAAKYCDRKQLEALIDIRFVDPVPASQEGSPERQIAESRHRFWALNAFYFTTARCHEALAELRRDPRSVLSIAESVGRFGTHESDSIPPLSADAIFGILDAYVDAWPKVPLPSSFGTGDPDNEVAYRFLRDVVWRIGDDTPVRKLPVLDRLLADTRFADYRTVLLGLRADTLRDAALQDFRPPSVDSVVDLLDKNAVASVEDLRALMLEELNGVQTDVKGLDTDPLDTFYDGGKHVNENTARNRVVDMVRARLKALGIPVVIEHYMAQGNRADFTATAPVSGTNPILVVEAKGQWHSELFTAASAQLRDRYSIHPDASGQGIYLVFWFGNGETVAGKADITITSAAELRVAILKVMSEEIKKSIDVVVLDLFRPGPKPKATKAKGDAVKKARKTSVMRSADTKRPPAKRTPKARKPPQPKG
jgi:AcrR family transcriptional regulator